MIRHSLFFSFKPTAPNEACEALLREYSTFPQVHKKMRNFTLGKNISQRDQTFEYAFNVDFDNEQDLKDYLNSHEHEEHVVERFRPLVSARAIVSYEVADGAVTNLFD